MGKGSNAQKNKQARDRNQAKDSGGQSKGGGAAGIAARTGAAHSTMTSPGHSPNIQGFYLPPPGTVHSNLRQRRCEPNPLA